MKAITLRLRDERLWQAARREAQKRGISLAAFVRESLKQKLKEAKDAERG
jgi:predicted HicB family RNase H-like nuclease